MEKIIEKKGIAGKLFAFFIVAFLLGLGTASNRAEARNQGPCSEDIATFCKDVQPGAGIGKCLKEHENELSPACKEGRGKMKKRMNEFQQACNEDVQKFCKDVKPGGGGIVRCLKEHESELSPECKTNMPSRKTSK